MTADEVDAHCTTLRGAEPDYPFGPEIKVWKVAGKMFAAYAPDGTGISLKCRDPHTASLLIELGKASQPDYLRDAGWVMVSWTTSRDELLDRLSTSYETVLQGLSPNERLIVGQAPAPPRPIPARGRDVE